MDVPEGNISAKKITAENINIELGGELAPHQQASTGGLVALGTTRKLKSTTRLRYRRKYNIGF